MPKIIDLFGYRIFFFSNENAEPPHVHVGKSQHYSSKIWLAPVSLAHNKSKIPDKDLSKIIRWIKIHRNELLDAWNNFFK